MEQVIIGSIIGGASFLSGIFGGIFTAAKVSGKREQKVDGRLENLETKTHAAPCPDIQAIKTSVAKIETNVEWLVREGKNGKG